MAYGITSNGTTWLETRLLERNPKLCVECWCTLFCLNLLLLFTLLLVFLNAWIGLPDALGGDVNACFAVRSRLVTLRSQPHLQGLLVFLG
jgi:hypothetical protein